MDASVDGQNHGKLKVRIIKQTWDMIDNKKNDSSLCGFGNSNTFICQNITNEFYRFIRIQEIISYNGADSESHHFILSEIEFYGSIKE